MSKPSISLCLVFVLVITANAFSFSVDSTLLNSKNKPFVNVISSPSAITLLEEESESYGNPTSASNLQPREIMPVRCFITESEQGKAVAHFPKISEEVSGKKVEVKQIKYGEYEFVIEKGRKYFIECNVVGYKNFEQSADISSIVFGELNTYEITLSPYRENENFILKNIYFHPNTPVFKTQSSNELAQLFSYMKNNSQVIISIEGHTNSNRYIKRERKRTQIGGKWAFHGTARQLSKERAEEVKFFLTKNGIDESRIKTKGWGGRKELYPDATTLSDSMKNMRVEIHILKK